MKKMNKKGFTLAELLIVVAVIAVLTAIAVPLFVGALNGAQEAVFNSNRDAVRSAGIVKVVGQGDTYMDQLTATKNTIVVTGTFKKEAKKWVLDTVAIEAPTDKPTTVETTFEAWNVSDETRKTIVVYLKATDLTK